MSITIGRFAASIFAMRHTNHDSFFPNSSRARGRGGCPIGLAKHQTEHRRPRPHRRRLRHSRPEPATATIRRGFQSQTQESSSLASHRTGSGVPMPEVPPVHRRSHLGREASQPLPQLPFITSRRSQAPGRSPQRLRIADGAEGTHHSPQRRADDPPRVPGVRQEPAHQGGGGRQPGPADAHRTDQHRGPRWGHRPNRGDRLTTSRIPKQRETGSPTP